MAAKAANARRNVPMASRAIPAVGLMLFASSVEPRLVESPEAKMSLKVRPAKMPPVVWKRRYGTSKSFLMSLADAAASASAGLITAPECSPMMKMIAETVPPNVRATRTKPSVVCESESIGSNITDVGPAITRT